MMPVECKKLSDGEELAVAIRSLIEQCPDIPYFTEKHPDILIASWRKLMAIGIGCQYAAYADGKPVGIMLGMISPDILSPTKQALECVWQVVPEYRKSGAGPALMKMFEDDAKQAGCARIIFGASTSYKYEPMVRLYRKLGYKPISLAMSKDLC